MSSNHPSERRFTLPEVIAVGLLLALVLAGVATAAARLFDVSSGQVAAVVDSTILQKDQQ